MAFIGHYVILKNATQAAIKAGYAPKHADVTGPRVLGIIRVKAEVDRRLAAQAQRLDISADKIIENLARIANGTVADFLSLNADGQPVFDFSSMTRDQMAALRSITIEEFKDGRSDKREVRRIKAQLNDPIKANELLGIHFGLFTKKVEVDHKLTIMGRLLAEIDEEARGKVIEHIPGEASDG